MFPVDEVIMNLVIIALANTIQLAFFLLTWFNLNPNMDK